MATAGKLAYRATRAPIQPELKAALARHKGHVVDLLMRTRPSGGSASPVLEFEAAAERTFREQERVFLNRANELCAAGMRRDEAELVALREVIAADAQWVNVVLRNHSK